MNEFTHFFTGYLAARFCKQKSGHFLLFFTAFAAIVPDMDFIVGRIIPSIRHGEFSHTILGGLLFELIYTVIVFAILFPMLSKSGISFWKLFQFALIGLGMHLLLDSFTFYENNPGEKPHMYFWPIWDFPVHINTLFPSVTYEIRVWVEVVYSIIMGLYILVYDWGYKKNNPFLMFNPKKWVEITLPDTISDAEKKTFFPRAYFLWGIIFIIMIIYIAIY
jgi:hypothetical protein